MNPLQKKMGIKTLFLRGNRSVYHNMRART